MNLTEHDFTQALNGIQSPNIIQGTLDVVQRIVDQNATLRFISLLMSTNRSSGQSEDHAISQTMLSLEALGEVDQSLACILMADLWGIASENMMHDVCDSIDLWIYHCNSPALDRHVQAMASSEPNPGKRRHYEQFFRNRNSPPRA